MDSRIGTYVLQKNSIESFRAYVPPKLPPSPALDMQMLYPSLDQATRLLAELQGVSGVIPNVSLFVYMYVRKEALLSSQIEGTQSSLADLMLFESDQEGSASLEDVEEVSNYVKAAHYGLARIKNGFPLSLRLLREVHEVLLSGTRGAGKLPGEFRRTQNWIGGTRPGNALFVPPPPENMLECLSDLERFLHDPTVHVLIRAGLVHAQFETIHPFLDGNGRLGRLLIILLLCSEGVINDPILYVSLYLKQNRSTYYDLLQQVRLKGAWEAWLEFFLKAVIESSRQALSSVKEINALFEADAQTVEAMGRSRFSCLKVFEFFKKLPQASAAMVAAELEMSAPTARAALSSMVAAGILEEVTGKKRDRAYVYRAYLSVLERGAEPL